MDRGKTLVGVLGGLVSALAVTAGGLAIVRALRTPTASVSSGVRKAVPVVLRSSVPGAQLFIDGELCGTGRCELDVKPGAHTAESRKPGHNGETRDFTAPAEVELLLEPLAPSIELVSDLMTGGVRLDDRPPVALMGGSAQLSGFNAGPHRLQFWSGAFRAEFRFESQPGEAPRLTAAPAASTGLRAIVVAGAGSEGRLWTTEKQAELTIGARELGLVPESGIPLPPLERGAHRFSLKTGRGPDVSFAYELAPNPVAWISLRTNRRLGTLRLTVQGGDDAKVTLDGKDAGTRIRAGRALLLAAPGEHEVAVEKPGFVLPPPQRALVTDGAETELEFRLEPLPTRALLPLAGAAPGAVLAVDGRAMGAAGPDGSAILGDLEPGQRVITATRDGYLPGRWELKIGAGRNAALRATMQRAQATLRIANFPGAAAGVTVSLRRLGQFDDRAVKEAASQWSEGEYTLSTIDASGQRTPVRIRLEAGRETSVALPAAAPLAGTAIETAPAPATAAAKGLSLGDWEGLPGWNRQGDRMEAQPPAGGGILLAPTRASARTLVFTAHVRPGRGLRWVTQFRDSLNYTLYELSGDALHRFDMVRGNRVKRSQSRMPGAGAGETMRVRLSQQAGALQTSLFRAGQWVSLDSANSANGTGRFGFYLPDRDRVALSEFQYDPQ